MAGAFVQYSGSQALASAALSLTTNVAATGRAAAGFVSTVANFRRVDHVTLKADSAITETVTLTLNSAKGSAYDTLLDSDSLSARQDYEFTPLNDLYLGPGDNLTLSCTNNNTTGTVSAVIVCEE